jgi:Na+-transporting NADH:ubiquinone oxidoreductase subunit C
VPRLDSTRYTVVFAAIVCIVCALLVATAAVVLRDRQETNALLFRQKNVLLAAGLVKPDADVSRQQLLDIFERSIRVRLVELSSGQLAEPAGIDPKSYDQRKARNDPGLSTNAPANAAGVARLPRYGTVYQVVENDDVKQVVIPIEGVGMWGGVFGFLALDTDGRTIRGITFYEQKETPGLGGEISNPKWQALWLGRKAYDENWQPKIALIKGRAGPPDKDPYHIDALSGATITSNAVSRIVGFWLSEAGYGKYLRSLNQGAKT